MSSSRVATAGRLGSVGGTANQRAKSLVHKVEVTWLFMTQLRNVESLLPYSLS